MEERMILNLFDFDGTLVDTELQLFHAYQEAFRVHANTVLDFDVWKMFRGKHIREIAERYDIPEDQLMKVITHKATLYPSQFNFVFNEELFGLVGQANTLSYICTATSVNVVHQILIMNQAALEAFSRFNGILSTKDIGAPKPSPAIYLLAFFDAVRDNYVDRVDVYEDSTVGLDAAHRFSDIVQDAFPKIRVNVNHVTKYER